MKAEKVYICPADHPEAELLVRLNKDAGYELFEEDGRICTLVCKPPETPRCTVNGEEK